MKLLNELLNEFELIKRDLDNTDNYDDDDDDESLSDYEFDIDDETDDSMCNSELDDLETDYSDEESDDMDFESDDLNDGNEFNFTTKLKRKYKRKLNRNETED
jgi:hypothetical protein